jgi:DNA helicase HerA-like ATPase
VLIADLSGVPNQVLQRIVSVLLRLIYESLIWARKLSEGGRERPLLIVLEEAHRYLNDSNDAAGEIIERIVKEGRKFGVGTLIVSQRPSEIRPTVLSQLGSFIVHRLSNSSDRGLVPATLPDNLAGLFDVVPILRTGEALVTGEIVKLPVRIVIDVQGSARPDSSDPEVIGRELPGGWDVPRVPQDYEDVAWVWRHLTPNSRRLIDSAPDDQEEVRQ